MTINNHYLTPTPPPQSQSSDYDSEIDEELDKLYGHTAPSVSATAAAIHNMASRSLPVDADENDEKEFLTDRTVSVLSGGAVDSSAPSAASISRADTPGIDPASPPKRQPPVKGLIIPTYIGMDPYSRTALDILNGILREPPDSLAALRTHLENILRNDGEQIAFPFCQKLFDNCALHFRGAPLNPDQAAACIARVAKAALKETAVAIQFSDVERTLEISVLKEIIKEAPDSLEKLETLLHAIQDRAIPPKYKRVVEHLAERTRGIEAMKLPMKDESALKEKVLQEIVLNPEDMEQDQAAIRKLKGELQILDQLFEALAVECVTKIEKMEMRVGGQLKPHETQKQITNAAEKLLKATTRFPTPPKPLIPKPVGPGHAGGFAYNSALTEQRFNRELPAFLRAYETAMHEASVDDMFEEDWPREIDLYAQEHEQGILDDFACEDALESVLKTVEAPYIEAATAIDEILKRVNSHIYRS